MIATRASVKNHLATALVLLALLVSGCFVGTPREELERLGASIEELPAGGVSVSLAGSNFGDGDVSYLLALSSNHSEIDYVADLDLSRTNLSDAGLQPLVRGLKNLRRLDLSETRCSAEGIRAARAALPDCEVLP